MVKPGRGGLVRLGCLVAIIVAGLLAYAAIVIGSVYARNYRFRDAMSQESRFAQRTTDAEIVNRLRAKADSLGLPDEAHSIRVQRSDRAISIWTQYSDTVDLHLLKRVVRFSPQVEHEW